MSRLDVTTIEDLTKKRATPKVATEEAPVKKDRRGLVPPTPEEIAESEESQRIAAELTERRRGPDPLKNITKKLTESDTNVHACGLPNLFIRSKISLIAYIRGHGVEQPERKAMMEEGILAEERAAFELYTRAVRQRNGRVTKEFFVAAYRLWNTLDENDKQTYPIIVHRKVDLVGLKKSNRKAEANG